MIDFSEYIDKEIYRAITKDESIKAAFTVDDYSQHPFVEIGAIELEQTDFPKKQWYRAIVNIRVEAKGNHAKKEANELSSKCVDLLETSFRTDWDACMINRYAFRIRRDKFMSEDGKWIHEKDIFLELIINLSPKKL